MKLSFDRKLRIITIHAKDTVDLREFYIKIREWEAMPINMPNPSVVRGSGRVHVAGGLRTVPVVALLGWRISSDEPLTISGGHLSAVDTNHEAVSPVDPGATHLIKLEH